MLRGERPAELAIYLRVRRTSPELGTTWARQPVCRRLRRRHYARVRHWQRRGLSWIAGILLGAGLAAFVLVLLGPVTWLIAGSTVRGVSDPKARADAVSTVRGSILTAAAGAAAIVALYFTAAATT